MATLIISYNAGSGLFDKAMDQVHKLLSPSTYACDLCKLTHGPFGMRSEWEELLSTFAIDVEFLHKEEHDARFEPDPPELPNIQLMRKGVLFMLLDAGSIGSCKDLGTLLSVFDQAMLEHGMERYNKKPRHQGRGFQRS